MHTQMKRLILTLAALTPLIMLDASPADARCGKGYNVDRHGRCFPAYLDNRPTRHYGDRYRDRRVYRGSQHYAPYGYSNRHRDRSRGIIQFRF